MLTLNVAFKTRDATFKTLNVVELAYCVAFLTYCVAFLTYCAAFLVCKMSRLDTVVSKTKATQVFKQHWRMGPKLSAAAGQPPNRQSWNARKCLVWCAVEQCLLNA